LFHIFLSVGKFLSLASWPISRQYSGLSKFSVPPQLPPTPINVPLRHRPILPRERSVLDKVLDALVGDGPDRRYALICCRCASHNGMALAEEFEFLGTKIFHQSQSKNNTLIVDNFCACILFLLSDLCPRRLKILSIFLLTLFRIRLLMKASLLPFTIGFEIKNGEH
uniref:Endoplasmic reticulum junction formation protein lunapark n=1 Tax=Schistocephalus solidus TaxID=70667 RepID=A0A183TAS7_SCHSO